MDTEYFKFLTGKKILLKNFLDSEKTLKYYTEHSLSLLGFFRESPIPQNFSIFPPKGEGGMMAHELKILLVDDEAEFISSLAERLSLRGFKTLVATDGPGALELIEREPFHAVVLDVMMPGMNGLQTLNAIKKIDASVEVILLTGHTSLEAALEGIQAGAFDYLVKPVDVDELAFRLQDACEKRRLQSKQATSSAT
jgi:two-component system, OmpR family, response regulator